MPYFNGIFVRNCLKKISLIDSITAERNVMITAAMTNAMMIAAVTTSAMMIVTTMMMTAMIKFPVSLCGHQES